MSPHIVESNEARIPALGFGTWQLVGETCENMVKEALKIGYRHIDTASTYENESEVGRALKDSAVSRNEIFLTSKVWPDDFAPDDLQEAVDQSLKRLQTDYVDLLLLHWPNPEVPLEKTMRALCETKRAGKAKNIGISNFTIRLIKQAIETADEPLAVNQIEYHPFLDQSQVKQVMDEEGLILTAYCPIAQGKVMDDKVLKEIAQKHDKSPVQISLRWLMQQKNVCAVPRTSKPEHAKNNFEIFDFELSHKEIEQIDQLTQQNSRLVDPSSLAPEWDS